MLHDTQLLPRSHRREHMRAWKPGVLAPLLEPSIGDFIYRTPGAIVDLVRRHGSPLHLIRPDILQRNVHAMRAVLQRHIQHHEIFYGAKVNKSPALVRAAIDAGAGIDVSSPYELKDALRAGGDPRRMCASGPAKTPAFHADLVRHGVIVSLDSPQELSALESQMDAGPSVRRARVLLRYQPTLARNSRFGMPAQDVRDCLRRLARRPDQVDFLGFHFHLSGYACQDRVTALFELADVIGEARRLSLVPKIVNIGGGLPVRYVGADAYEAFLRQQGPDHYRNRKVPASFYPYGNRTDACAWLERFLTASGTDGQRVSTFLARQDLTLALEPGRSLADQAAFSVFAITRVKPLADRRCVIFIEGSSFSACETWFASEFLVDPILISSATATPADGVFPAYIAGHSCLDEDVLTNRLIEFPTVPQPGDLLVYANTGGYQMDLLENEFHRHPMPRRLVLDAGGGTTRAIPDTLDGDLR
ncbi:MAG TPA: Y4yA family PLP-dependent enzyme [Vineibacter sp.]|nr:Y4yA family PLP-dependent enzyme [Vineibacter sp.]